MPRRGTVLAAMAALLWIAAERQVSAGHLVFQYGTTVTLNLINPTSSVGGPGSQVIQAGVGNFAAPTPPTFNAGLNGVLGTDITVGSISVTDIGFGAYVDTYGPTTITIDLALKAVDSGAVGHFTFTGSHSGLVSYNGTPTAVNFGNPFVASSQIQNIGGTGYEVRIISDEAVSRPPAGDRHGLGGSISFQGEGRHCPGTYLDRPAGGRLSVSADRGGPPQGIGRAMNAEPQAGQGIER
jgi:hypothetical protein